MNKLSVLLLILVALPIAFAETKTITTTINATYQNGTNTVMVQGEGGYSSSISCSNGSITSFPAMFNRDFTYTTTECQSDVNNLTRRLDFFFSNMTTLQNEKAECIAAKERVIQTKDDCSENLLAERNTTSDLRQRHDSCQSQIGSLQVAQSELSTCKKTAEDTKSQKWLFGVIGTALGAGVYYAIKKKPEGKAPTDRMVR